MISLYQIKPKFQQLLRPILNRLFKWGVSANQITIASIVLSILLGCCVLLSGEIPKLILILPFGLLLRMMLNALDGMMARTYNMQSQFGEVLNEMGDVLSDIAIVLPFAFLPNSPSTLIWIFVLLSVLNEFAGVLSKALGKERRYDGPMGKSDRALFIGIYSLVYYFWNDFALQYSENIFAIASILIAISTLIRLKKPLV